MRIDFHIVRALEGFEYKVTLSPLITASPFSMIFKQLRKILFLGDCGMPFFRGVLHHLEGLMAESLACPREPDLPVGAGCHPNRQKEY